MKQKDDIFDENGEPRIMGGGDPLLLRIVMNLLMPIFWIIDLIKNPNDDKAIK